MTTTSGGNVVKGEINRNKQAPQRGVAPIEVAGKNMSAYEIVMICISAVGLLLALIKLINDLRK